MNSKKYSEVCSLEQIESELNDLLTQVKPEDKLKIGDTFVMQKDIKLPVNGKINKGEKIEILQIIEPEKENETTRIVYTCSSEKGECQMSKKVFIGLFCDIIIKEQNEFDRKLKELRDHEKQVKKIIKNDKPECATQEVKEKVNFIVKFTKLLKKKGHK